MRIISIFIRKYYVDIYKFEYLKIILGIEQDSLIVNFVIIDMYILIVIAFM